MSGTISVPGYPSTNRVPGVWAVVDASKANTGTLNQRALIIGQMLSSGTATAGQPVISAGIGDAQTSFGAGSQMSVMVERYRALDGFGELWCLPLADAGGSAAATMTIAYAGTATSPGVVPVYVDGRYIPVAVNQGDTFSTIATNTAAAINAWTSPGGNPLSWTAAVSSGTVTLTARNKGSVAMSGNVQLSYLGTAGGQGQPGTTNVPGVTASVTAPAGGTTDPVVANALANLAAVPYDFVICPYNDATSLNAIQSFLGDAAGRWNWSEELFGHCFIGYSGTFSARTSFGTARNDQHTSVIGAYGSPSPHWHWAADFGAASAVSLRSDPAIPVGGLGGGAALNVLPPAVANRDTFSERSTLLYDGFSTYVVDNSGAVRVERAVTTYQFNAGGAPDNSYLDLNVPFCLMAYIRAVRSMIQSNFNQVKLVADGSRIPPGSAMVTSKTILYSVIALYKSQSDQGLVQNPVQFAQQAQAQNAGSGVVRLLLPVQLANQLYDVAVNVQFTRP